MLSEEGEELARDIEISFTVRDFEIEGEHVMNLNRV